MKKNKLFGILLLLNLICLLSISVSFKQCGLSTEAGHVLSDDAMTTSAGQTGSSNKSDIGPGDKTESNIQDSTAENSFTTGTSIGIANNDGGSFTEDTSLKTASENGGQNSQESQKFAIVISGASYNKQHYNWFLGSTTLAYELLKKSGYTDENIYYLFEDKNSPDIDASSTMSEFKKAVQDIKSKSGAADTILVILIGHGSFDGTDSYYCLNDSNLADFEMADMFKTIKRDKLIFVFSPCNSGGFVDDLSGGNTVIITSTRKDEANRAAFIEPFLAAFDGSGDADSNGKVSFSEAFIYASFSVKKQYTDNSWGVLAEHPQIDDNGDKISSEVLTPGNNDGLLAGQIFLE